MESTMAKTKETVEFTDDSIIIKKTHDVTDDLHRARVLREAGVGMKGDKKLIGSIPMELITQWLKEAGVDFTDHEARQQVVKRKILSGEFDKFRVWKGTY
jgi:hypothetical protein